MDTFEVRSKSFTIKWVNVPSHSVVRWELKPLKKSINVGIYRHNQREANRDSCISLLKTLRGRPNGVNGTAGISTGTAATAATEDSSPDTSETSNSLEKPDLRIITGIADPADSEISTPPPTENLSVDAVNEVPREMFHAMHESFFSDSNGTAGTEESVNTPGGVNGSQTSLQKRHFSIRRNSSATLHTSLEEQIDRHLVREQWLGRCAGDEYKSDSFRVQTGGLFAFVFDNTFSKTKAKKVMFGQWVERDDGETGSIAESVGSVCTSPGKKSPAKSPAQRRVSLSTSIVPSFRSDSVGSAARPLIGDLSSAPISISAPTIPENPPPSLPTTPTLETPISEAQTPSDSLIPSTSLAAFKMPEEKRLGKNSSVIRIKGVQYLQGFIRKKRRRAGGNFVKRFFNLNFKYAVLDYYADESCTNIRGNMLVTQAVISADVQKQMLYLDSGMEQWILKALTPEDFDVWVHAFNYIKRRDRQMRQAPGGMPEMYERSMAAAASIMMSPVRTNYDTASESDELLDTYSAAAAALEKSFTSMELVAGRLLAAAKKQQQSRTGDDRKVRNRRSSFFFKKRGEEAEAEAEDRPEYHRSTSSLGSQADSGEVLKLVNQLYDQLAAAHSDYNALLASEALASSTTKPPLSRTVTSATSMTSQDFVDAEEMMEEMHDSVVIVDEEEDKAEKPKLSPYNIFDQQLAVPLSSVSLSTEGDIETETIQSSQFTHSVGHLTVLEEGAPAQSFSDLYPLPYHGESVVYRKDIPVSAVEAPSLMSILRKNLGKDLTGITMPIGSNEPLSFMQKYAESYEYCNILTAALQFPAESGERILRVACFAVSYLSSYRCNVRSLRKPFNPMLGETFEMVRPELGLRLVSEKVVHRPVVFAAHADSEHWCVSHTFQPEQKFYGKTAEVSMKGTVVLRYDNGETYTWTPPTTVLKNVISLTGEKYTEPNATMTIQCSTGYKVIVTFVPERSRFSSRRSEKVVMRAYTEDGKKLPRSVSGTWTESLHLDDTAEVIWQAGSLVSGFEHKFGFTEFAAGLNAMTAVDKQCAPTDSRRRPDQKMYEEGDWEAAEELKMKLEQDQRERRTDADGKPVEHTPAFFTKTGTELLDWQFVEGEQGYWERRRRQDWKGLLELW